MEVHGRQPGNPNSARERYEQGQERLTEAARARVARAREILEGLPEVRQEALREARGDATDERQGGDVLELSAGATRDVEALDLEREKRVEALREAFLEGSLNSPERIEQAAARMLGG